MTRKMTKTHDPYTDSEVFPPDNDWSQVCFFRKRFAKRWHRVIHFYPSLLTHLSYCGRLETVREDRMIFAGEWNAYDTNLLRLWKDCEVCERLYASEQ